MKREICLICGEELTRITEGGESRSICVDCGITDKSLDILKKYDTQVLTSQLFIHILQVWVGCRSGEIGPADVTVVMDGVELGLLESVITNHLVFDSLVYYKYKPLSKEVQVFKGEKGKVVIFLYTHKETLSSMDLSSELDTRGDFNNNVIRAFLKVQNVCKNCNGTGVIPYSAHTMCEACNGSGTV